MSDSFDCRTCGRCCFGPRDYVQVFAHDAERLGAERMSRLVAAPVGEIPASTGRPAEPRQFMRMVDGHCAALEISPTGRFTCTVHEHRPELCRALQVNSSPCVEARRSL